MSIVLVVEDETFVRMVATELLVDAGYQVLEARDADEALEILWARDDCRAVITDVKMPGSIDGLQLAHVVAELWPTIGVAVVSAHARLVVDDLPREAIFLPKPYRHDDLLETAARIVGGTT